MDASRHDVFLLAAPANRVFSALPNTKCFGSDLKLAGIAKKHEAGRFVDFHSLRVSLSTMLAAHKVSPRTAQALMRHSDPRLTAAVYTDERILPLAAELVSVPAIPAAQRHAEGREAHSDLQALVAGLDDGQRQALLGMLRRAQAG